MEKLKSIHIDFEKGIYQVNGENCLKTVEKLTLKADGWEWRLHTKGVNGDTYYFGDAGLGTSKG